MTSTSVWYWQILTVRKVILTGDFDVRTGTFTADYAENDSANYIPPPDPELIPRVYNHSQSNHIPYTQTTVH